MSDYFDVNKNYPVALSYLKKYNILDDSIQNKQAAFKDGIVSMVAEAKTMENQIHDLTK